MKNIIYFLACLIFVSIGLFYFNWNRNRLNRLAFENLNLQIIGVVYKIDKVKGYNGFGVANLKVLKSNVKMYDPRSKNEYYYCMLKNDRAEIYDIHVRAMSLGDTIKIDTKNKVIFYVNEGRTEEGTIIVNTDDSFYNYIKKHHQKL